MTTKRRGDWMQTFTGETFWPLDPREEEIHVEDIAHALSNQCRFAGHCHEFYSVAQHSVLVSQVVPAASGIMLWGLFHDASEAYLVDLPRPIKRHSEIGRHYRAAERCLMDVICRRFGLRASEPTAVMWADDLLLATEKRDVMNGGGHKPWEHLPVPLSASIVPMGPKDSERLFLDRFAELSP